MSSPHIPPPTPTHPPTHPPPTPPHPPPPLYSQSREAIKRAVKSNQPKLAAQHAKDFVRSKRCIEQF
jgi:hypothetical protein